MSIRKKWGLSWKIPPKTRGDALVFTVSLYLFVLYFRKSG